MGQAFEVKSDVLGFVRQDAGADLIENRNAGPPLQDAVISHPDQFRDEQDLNFKIQSERTPRAPKEEMSPMALDDRTAKPPDQALEQSRVFAFFGDEEFEGAPVSGVRLDLLRGFAEEMLAAATFAELEMRK